MLSKIIYSIYLLPGDYIYIYKWVSGAPCAIQAQWGTHLANVWHFEDLTRQFLRVSWIGSYGNSRTKVGISFG
jgi:hypothetical protein